MLIPPDIGQEHADRPFAGLSDALLEEGLTRANFHGQNDERRLQLLLLERSARRLLSHAEPIEKGVPGAESTV